MIQDCCQHCGEKFTRELPAYYSRLLGKQLCYKCFVSTLGEEVDREVELRNPVRTSRTTTSCQCCSEPFTENNPGAYHSRVKATVCRSCFVGFTQEDSAERRSPSSFHSKAKLAANFPLSAKKTLCREYAQVRLCRTFIRKSPHYRGAIGFKAT